MISALLLVVDCLPRSSIVPDQCSAIFLASFFPSVGVARYDDLFFRCRSCMGYPAKVRTLRPLRQVNTAPDWRIIAIKTRLQGNHGSRNGSIASALRLSLELANVKTFGNQ